MPLYVVERVMPGCGEMTDDQARQAILASLEVLDELGDGIKWFRSFVVDKGLLHLLRPGREPYSPARGKVGAAG